MLKVGSVCSGIEAASVALTRHDFSISWLSEISDFPSQILREKYPNTPNVGDMCDIPGLLADSIIDAPDIICGGTPCQAFSLAGWKEGLSDERGNLTLKFIDIIQQNDQIRKKQHLDETIMLWENVEGVLRNKTNPFGCFISSLAGSEIELNVNSWPLAGVIHGRTRNIAWRVLDAKYFGLPQQRRRLYVLAGGPSFFPENVLFDGLPSTICDYTSYPLSFDIDGSSIEVFRSYTDCLYSAYGTKWNGNAAAYNGSLYVSQNNRLRRLTPLECERLMGFPDHYTQIPLAKRTNRYQALGNSWAVPVIDWIGKRLKTQLISPAKSVLSPTNCLPLDLGATGSGITTFEIISSQSNPTQSLLAETEPLNGSVVPEFPREGDLRTIIDVNPPEKLFLSPVGCKGILRRKEERQIKINARLESRLKDIASTMPEEEIERRSRVQRRGRFSAAKSAL